MELHLRYLTSVKALLVNDLFHNLDFAVERSASKICFTLQRCLDNRTNTDNTF